MSVVDQSDRILVCRHGEIETFERDSGAVSASLRAYGEWAENELRFLRRFIRKGGTVVDVGAYIGTHAVAFAAAVGPLGRVIAMEPQAASFELLSRNIARNGLAQVQAEQAAAGSATSEITIRAIDPATTGSFGSQALAPPDDRHPALVVPVMTLDSLGLAACDLIKIDVEGHEDGVIEGAAATIGRHQPLVYAECNSLEDGLRAWQCLKRIDGLSVRLHVVKAFNPQNFRQFGTNIFGEGREAALVGYFARHLPDLDGIPKGPESLLLEIGTADDLALGLLHKPQYKDEVLSQGAAARSGGTAWLSAQSGDDARASRALLVEREAALVASESALAAATDEVAVLHAQLAAATGEVASFRAQIAARQRRLEAAIDAARQAERDRAAMLRSTSWKITAPLRRLAGGGATRPTTPPAILGELESAPAQSTVRGSLEQAGRFCVTGWAQDQLMPNERLTATIHLGEKPVAAVLCHEYRSDLAASGIGDGCHAFSHTFASPLSEEDAARIRVVVAGTEIPRLPQMRRSARSPFVLPSGLSTPESYASWAGIDFSQYGEQAHILRYFEEHGSAPRFVIDLGAYDGEIGSNSRALIVQGWAGLLVEPDPRTFARLAILYAERPDVMCLRCAVSDTPGHLDMQFTTGPVDTSTEEAWKYAQVNTLETGMAGRVAAELGYQYVRHPVPVATLESVLDWVHAPREVGFLSIDCEGVDVKIVRSMDFSRCRPWLISVECDDSSRPMMDAALRPAGYEEYARTQANTLFRWHGAEAT